MQFKLPKSDKYQWTRHSVYKMRQYSLSAQRVIRVIRNPERVEEGIVPRTVAMMQPASVKYKNFKKIWSQEIWVMYQIKNQSAKIKNQNDPEKSLRDNGAGNAKFKNIHDTKYKVLNTKIRIISAWRYPGISPQNNPIPEEILKEIRAII